MKRSHPTSLTSISVATLLAACYSFFQQRALLRPFEPTAAHWEYWRSQAQTLVSPGDGDDLRSLVARVEPAWPLALGEDPRDGVAIDVKRGCLCLFTRTPQPLILRPPSAQPPEEEDEEEKVAVCCRPPRLPTVFAKQRDAFAACDALPPGLLRAWAVDIRGATNGSKSYLVAGVDDMWHYYRGLPPEQRSHYEILRGDTPVCLVVDAEYYLRCDFNRQLNPHELVRDFIHLVEEEEEEGRTSSEWRVYDSSSAPGLIGGRPVTGDKVSVRLIGRHAWFPNLKHSQGEFLRRLQQRAPPSLLVATKAGDDRTFFADLSIYSANRLIRLPYSSKGGEMRFLIPVELPDDDELDRGAWQDALASEIQFEDVPRLPPPAQPQHRQQEQEQQENPPLVLHLQGVVQRHFEPERMRNVLLQDNGICTFLMVQHECREICNDRHNNQVYAVADLKRRVYYAKCNANRRLTGPEHPFPPELAEHRLVRADDFQPGGFQGIWVLRPESASAHAVLRFLRAIFGVTGVTSRIPLPGTEAVVWDHSAQHYEMPLGVCESDGGSLILTMNREGALVRCVGGNHCGSRGWRLQRPTRSAGEHAAWDLSFLMPPPLAAAALTVDIGGGGESAVAAFLAAPNFFQALGFGSDAIVTPELCADRLAIVEQWALNTQQTASADQRDANGVHVVAARVRRQAGVMRAVLLDPHMEAAYRECLVIAPAYVYPMALTPKGVQSLAITLVVQVARQKGYRRVGEEFHVPVTTAAGTYYQPVPLHNIVTRIFTYDQTPNLYEWVVSGRNKANLEGMLSDENHWPSLPPSKRYLGFRNVVYDLVDNEAMPWEVVLDPAHADVMPFNCLGVAFPVETLAQARRDCPRMRVEANRVAWEDVHAVRTFVETPRLDQPLVDQGFDDETMAWFYALFGRMFHRVGKNTTAGDNWEIVPCCQGAPGTGKSSIVAVLESYLQPTQFGVIATKTEERFPITALMGKLMVFLTEMGGCDLDKELLKQMVSGDPVNVAGKFLTASVVPNWDIPLWLCGNTFLDLRDVDGSVGRRIAMFAFCCMLRAGQGDVDLVQRIVEEEQATLLIKCNTLYLAMKEAIRRPVHSLLPARMQEACTHALMQNDSLYSFCVQEHVVVAAPCRGRMAWNGFWERYLAWCRHSGRPVRTDVGGQPHHPGVMALITRMGARIVTSRSSGTTWILQMRPRDVSKGDSPFQSAFAIRLISRRGEEASDEDDYNSSSMSNSSSSSEEGR